MTRTDIDSKIENMKSLQHQSDLALATSPVYEIVIVLPKDFPLLHLFSLLYPLTTSSPSLLLHSFFFFSFTSLPTFPSSFHPTPPHVNSSSSSSSCSSSSSSSSSRSNGFLRLSVTHSKPVHFVKDLSEKVNVQTMTTEEITCLNHFYSRLFLGNYYSAVGSSALLPITLPCQSLCVPKKLDCILASNI